MAKAAIGVGSSANDGTGDDLRSGAIKINANFDEIYTELGDGTNLASASSTQTLTNKTLTAPSINGVVGGTQTSATITTLTTAGITGTGGALEITADNNVVEFRGDGTNGGVVGTIQLNCSANSHGQKIVAQPHSAQVTNTMTLPAGASSTLVSLVSQDTLTNKTLTAPTITGAGAIAGVFTGNITGNVTGNVTSSGTSTFATIDVNGGAIDGAIIGANSAAAITGTAISGTSIAVTGTGNALKVNTVTTTQRNALTAANGMVVYNSTDSKIQAYAGGAWVNLH